jgi:signal transduction histidine kinase
MTDASQLSRRLAVGTACAWVAGVLLLAAMCIALAHRSLDHEVDAKLLAVGLAAYGLGWWDSDGHFHDEYLLLEEDLFGGDVHITFATPDGTVWGPSAPEHAALVDETQSTLEDVWVRGATTRSYARPTYDDDDQPVGTVIATMSTGPMRQASRQLGGTILVVAFAFILAGLVFSRRLSASLLAAFQASMDERERILAGAAHELRTPVATLLAIVDSSEPERAEQALGEVRLTATAAAGMVDRLLTWSRLQRTEPTLEPVRLDLLVELCLEEGEPFEAQATVVSADPRLVEVAVRNLVENARVHGGGVELVRVGAGRVEVHDRGPGMPDDDVLAPFCKGEDSPGTGLGLALVQRIAERHRGTLELRPVVVLRLPVAG